MRYWPILFKVAFAGPVLAAPYAGRCIQIDVAKLMELRCVQHRRFSDGRL